MRKKIARDIDAIVDSLPMSRLLRIASKLSARFIFPALGTLIRHTPRAVNARAVVLTDWSKEPEEAIRRKCWLCGEDVWLPIDWLPSAVYGPWPEHKACTERDDYNALFRARFC